MKTLNKTQCLRLSLRHCVLIFLLYGKAQVQDFPADILLADTGGVIVHRQIPAAVDADGIDAGQSVQFPLQQGLPVGVRGIL